MKQAGNDWDDDMTGIFRGYALGITVMAHGYSWDSQA